MSGPLLLVALIVAVVFIVVATARWGMHPFLVLLLTAYALGLVAGLPGEATVEAIVSGFGGTIGYIGIVIAAGTIIGVVLERSGGALVMAETVLRLVGKERSAAAIGVTGAVVSVPVFCDSGFIILAPLARSLAARSGASMAFYGVALSMGLYTTHVFIPPTPGPIAAAGELGADIGTVIGLGLVTTVPVLMTTYLFARAMGRRIYIPPEPPTADADPPGPAPVEGPPTERPSAGAAFAPVVLPVLLIGIRSVVELPGAPLGSGGFAAALGFLGNPNTALLLGAFLAFALVRPRRKRVWGPWVADALTSAGPIILITGAGGALGAVLRATPVADFLGQGLSGVGLGAFSILVPFVLAAALKTALGSSTVAIITTASLVAPLLPALGLGGGIGLALATLAIGAGAMTVSHANDSYFWVVSQFTGMTVAQAYGLQTGGSAVAGLTGITAVLVLRLLLI